MKEDLGSSMAPKASWLNDGLPENMQKLLKEYLSLFNTDTLSKENFLNIWNAVDKDHPIGKGGFGTVYSSADGKYALKVANGAVGDMGDYDPMKMDQIKNETLLEHSKDFDPSQFYYRENSGFIAKYAGTFKTNDGIQVAVFEKIDGADFDKCNARTLAQQSRLLAQAATAIAISHEAGCINSDIKPANMMVTKDFSLLILIDQGELVDLTRGIKTPDLMIGGTGQYQAPECVIEVTENGITKTKGNTIHNIAPAFDVFSLGVTILQKFHDVSNSEKGTPQETFIENIFIGLKTEGRAANQYLQQIGKNPEEIQTQFCRKAISETIAKKSEELCLFGTREESKFIGQLLQDCLAYKPENRISAAQAAEILQTFSSYLENPVGQCPDYNQVKAIAIQDNPKGVPIAIRKMVFHSDPEIQQKAVVIVDDLAKADPSYKNTPSYGMVALLHGDDAFSGWAREYPNSLQQLKDRIHIFGNDHNPEQDMPVSQENYDKIQAFGTEA